MPVTLTCRQTFLCAHAIVNSSVARRRDIELERWAGFRNVLQRELLGRADRGLRRSSRTWCMREAAATSSRCAGNVGAPCSNIVSLPLQGVVMRQASAASQRFARLATASAMRSSHRANEAEAVWGGSGQVQAEDVLCASEQSTGSLKAKDKVARAQNTFGSDSALGSSRLCTAW